MKALVLLSGGQDSTTCLFWAMHKYGAHNVAAIGFDYNQRHKIELSHAKNICDAHSIPFTIAALPAISQLTDNALTNTNMALDLATPPGAPPNTLVEGRNLLFLTYAAIHAKGLGIKTIVTGLCETDFSNYPDCRDTFVKSCNVTLNLGMDYPFVIETPLMWLTKAEAWHLAHELGVLEIIRDQTLTCYNGIPGQGCNTCPACDLRKKGYDAYVRDKKNI